MQVNFIYKPQLKTVSFENYKHGYLLYTSGKAFKDTLVNRALSSLDGESLEITFTLQ